MYVCSVCGWGRGWVGDLRHVVCAQVLYLALNAQEPTVAKEKKKDWWAVSSYLWGFMDPAHFPKKPDFEPLRGSKSLSMFESVDPGAFALAASVKCRTRLCMCPPCRPKEGGSTYGDCEVKNDGNFGKVVGISRRYEMKRKRDLPQYKRATRSQQPEEDDAMDEDLDRLAQFAATFEVGEVVAMNIDDTEKDEYIENDFWLAVVESKPQQLAESCRFKGTLLEKGRWVFDLRWLYFATADEEVDGGPCGARHYEIKDDEVHRHDVGAVYQLPPPPDAEGEHPFLYIGSMTDERRVRGGTFTLDGRMVEHITVVMNDGEGLPTLEPEAADAHMGEEREGEDEDAE